MIDINKDFEQLLKSTEYNVAYQFPKQGNELPIITYYEASNTGGFSADNQEWGMISAFVVDIWAITPKQTGDIGVKVDEVLQQSGWRREFAANLPRETDSDVYHRTMRYVKEIFY